MTDSSLDIMIMIVCSIEIQIKIIKVKVPKKDPIKKSKENYSENNSMKFPYKYPKRSTLMDF